MHFDTSLHQVIGKVFSHALGQSGDEDALPHFYATANFFEQVINLTGGWADFYLGINQTGRADDLLDDMVGALQFIGARGGAGIDGVAHVLLKLIESQRAVIHGRGEAEAVFNQGAFTRAVTVVHPPNLGDGHMGLVNDEQVITGEVINQRPGWGPGGALVQLAGVVFDAGAVTNFAEHFKVITTALFQALRFEQLALALELCQAFFQFLFDVDNGGFQAIFLGDVMLGGVNGDFGWLGQDFTRQGVDCHHAFNFIAKEGDPVGLLLFISGEDFKRIAAHAKRAGVEVKVIALILALNQLAEEGIAAVDGALL